MANRRNRDTLRPRRTGWLRLLAALPLILAVCLFVRLGARRNAERLVPLEVVRATVTAPVAETIPPPEETVLPEATAPPEATAAPEATIAPEVTIAPEESDPSEITYVLNTSKRKFHRADCASVRDMSGKNRQDFTGSRDEVIAMGYEPCKRCNP